MASDDDPLLDRLGGARERLLSAIKMLAVSAQPLPERLEDAVMEVWQIAPGPLPKEIQVKLEYILARASSIEDDRDGNRFAATLAVISEDECVAIAEEIFALYNLVMEKSGYE